VRLGDSLKYFHAPNWNGSASLRLEGRLESRWRFQEALELADDLFFVQAEHPRILPDKALGEDAPRQSVEALVLDGF
jgi:hypothetical protein